MEIFLHAEQSPKAKRSQALPSFLLNIAKHVSQSFVI